VLKMLHFVLKWWKRFIMTIISHPLPCSGMKQTLIFMEIPAVILCWYGACKTLTKWQSRPWACKDECILKSVVFWVITRCRVVIVYRRFGTTYRSHPHRSRVWVHFPHGLLTCEDGTGMLSRNVGKQLPHDAA
jgi:hypothetical protein